MQDTVYDITEIEPDGSFGIRDHPEIVCLVDIFIYDRFECHRQLGLEMIVRAQAEDGGYRIEEPSEARSLDGVEVFVELVEYYFELFCIGLDGFEEPGVFFQ